MLETGGTWKGFEWLTPGGVVPTDTPECGFLRELCPEIETGNIAALNKMECYATTSPYIKQAYPGSEILVQ